MEICVSVQHEYFRAILHKLFLSASVPGNVNTLVIISISLPMFLVRYNIYIVTNGSSNSPSKMFFIVYFSLGRMFPLFPHTLYRKVAATVAADEPAVSNVQARVEIQNIKSTYKHSSVPIN